MNAPSTQTLQLLLVFFQLSDMGVVVSAEEETEGQGA